MSDVKYHQIKLRNELEETFGKDFLWCRFSNEVVFEAEFLLDWKDHKTSAELKIKLLKQLVPDLEVSWSKVRLNVQGRYKVLILVCKLPDIYMQEN